MSGRSGHVRQFPTSKAQIAYSARFLNYPGKAKRESCRKKAHNDGHVPHHRHEATPVVENNSLHSLKPSEAQKSGKEISVSKSLHSHRHESTPVVESNTLHSV